MPRFRETLLLTSHSDKVVLEIPDQEGHFYSLYRVTMLSTNPRPAKAEGVALEYNKHTWHVTQENWEGGKKFIDHGYGERVMPNGDRIWYTLDGQSGETEITGGTGKFQNIKGKGQYKGEYGQDNGEYKGGNWQGWHEWEYELG